MVTADSWKNRFIEKLAGHRYEPACHTAQSIGGLHSLPPERLQPSLRERYQFSYRSECVLNIRDIPVTYLVRFRHASVRDLDFLAVTMTFRN